MSKVQWQSNDKLSVYDTNSKKVYMGTRNVKVAGADNLNPFVGDRSWNYFNPPKLSGTAHVSVLSPVEALEIKFGKRTEDQVAVSFRNTKGQTLWTGWKIVFERVMNSREMRNALAYAHGKFKFPGGGSLSPARPSEYSSSGDIFIINNVGFQESLKQQILDMAQKRAEAEVANAENAIYEGFRNLSQQLMTPGLTPPAISSRFKVNGVTLNTASAPISSNVFSLDPNKASATPDPKMDYILSIYAKAVTSPSSKNVGLPPQASILMHSENLYTNYPRLNMAPLRAKSHFSHVRTQLYMARVWVSKLASADVSKFSAINNIAQSRVLGSRSALQIMFWKANNEEKLLMAKAAYPYLHGKNYARKTKMLRSAWSAKVNLGGTQTSLNYQYLLGDIFWVDYLCQGSALGTQTVKYLKWVKDKVAVAVRSFSSKQEGEAIEALKAMDLRPSKVSTASKAGAALALIGSGSKSSPLPKPPILSPIGIGTGIASGTKPDNLQEPPYEEDDFELLDEDDVFADIQSHSDPIMLDLDDAVDEAETFATTAGEFEDYEGDEGASLATENEQQTSSDSKPAETTPSPKKEEETSNTKYIIGGVAVVALVGGYVWYQRKK